MSFAKLKKSRASELEKLAAAAEKQVNPNKIGDDYWKPERDKAGNGQAIIRFLPAGEGDDNPWITYYDHWFKGPTGQYYIEKSLTTIGKEDPVGEYNSTLWNTGLDEDKETARSQKRRMHYVSNIYVVKDFANPENNGKVMQFRFGKKIFDKIKDAMDPVFEGDEPINPFDLWEGANFNIKITEVDGWPNYDKSDFANKSALLDGDEAKLEEIYNSMSPLSDVIAEDKFKSYADLKAKLYRVLNITSDAPTVSSRKEKVVEAKVLETVRAASESEPVEVDDDSLAFFQNMIEED